MKKHTHINTTSWKCRKNVSNTIHNSEWLCETYTAKKSSFLKIRTQLTVNFSTLNIEIFSRSFKIWIKNKYLILLFQLRHMFSIINMNFFRNRFLKEQNTILNWNLTWLIKDKSWEDYLYIHILWNVSDITVLKSGCIFYSFINRALC